MNDLDNNKLPILYSFRRCPYAMRARMALEYAGISCEIREVHLKNKPKSMLEYSPKGTVPVLALATGEVIDESMDIISYALSCNDPRDLLNNETGIEEQVQDAIQKADNEFIKLVSRYKYFERFPEYSQAEYLKQIEEQFLNHYEKQLATNGYIVSSKETKADIAIIPFMRQFSYVNKEYLPNSKYTYICKWLDSFIDTNSFDIVMHKYDVWQEGDDVNIFPLSRS